jgi:hypothetical protein
MSSRIGFQVATIFLIATTVGWKADQNREEAMAREVARDERRRLAKERKAAIAAASSVGPPVEK